MYHEKISQKTSPLINSHSESKDINPSRNYGSLSSVVQRAQQDVNSISGDEKQKLESAIGTKATGEVLTGKQWVPEFKGISGQLWDTVPVQAKLTIGEVGDKYEREADKVAKDVVQQISAPQSPQPQTTINQESEKIQPKYIVQRREAVSGGEASTDLESGINSARGSGKPLDLGLQQSMGQAMGADFSGVRVHTDAASDRLNQSIQAKAFTTGQDVFFRKGEYQPGSRQGQELIAHELTHVVQQTGQISHNKHESTENLSRNPIQQTSSKQLQRKSVNGVNSVGLFRDLGNGLFGSDTPVNANDVVRLVNAIHSAPGITNIKILTGTHGTPNGHLVGEPIFYQEDLENEGHQVQDGGWVNVLNVRRKTKDTVGRWKTPGSSVVIMAWCYSSRTHQNWAGVNASWDNGATWVW
ncbi:hypothetical protein NIES267_42830 [Calothrix parasitica NIES-267]|uniref:eCIS core domain-containing protein n=1 Tax=Calothrix parasitica NIES-267 TaxID=1973488 RepID=A0A1Z4LU56_9CYAN|nr:hypothetical protein NIES267_42830 [Calothrix parasitica NIES-267]